MGCFPSKTHSDLVDSSLQPGKKNIKSFHFLGSLNFLVIKSKADVDFSSGDLIQEKSGSITSDYIFSNSLGKGSFILFIWTWWVKFRSLWGSPQSSS